MQYLAEEDFECAGIGNTQQRLPDFKGERGLPIKQDTAAAGLLYHYRRKVTREIPCHACAEDYPPLCIFLRAR